MKRTGIMMMVAFFAAAAAAVSVQAASMDSGSTFLYPRYSKKISMDFQEAPLVDVLKIFSQQTGYNLISSENLASRKITVYLDDVPVDQALEQILKSNNLTYELQSDSDIYIVKPLSRPDVEMITRVYPLKHATVTTSKILKTLIINTGDDEDAEIEVEADENTYGIFAAVKAILTEKGNLIEDPRTNSLIISDIATNFTRIENTIARLDVPVPQILIEVEMLEVTKEIVDKIGIKHGQTPLTFSGAQRDHVYPWNQNDLLRKGYFFEEAEYRVGTIDASGLTMALDLLRTDKDTKSLARPRILTLNNQPAQIKISTDEAIGSKTQTTSAEGVGASSVEAERVETGVFLTVTPQANILTGEIMMAVFPKVVIARTGGTFNSITFKDPEERGTQSLLKVQSGDTIVIGGLIRTESDNIQTKIPILGDIPFFGAPFRHKDKTKTERELIIFITPHMMSETPVPQTDIAQTAPLIREQNIPQDRLQRVEKELHDMENKKL